MAEQKTMFSSNPKSSLTLYALFIYCPVLESTRISSPMFTKEGTVTTAPVSRVAGFVPPCALSLAPGSVSVTVSLTVMGSSKSMIYKNYHS